MQTFLLPSLKVLLTQLKQQNIDLIHPTDCILDIPEVDWTGFFLTSDDLAIAVIVWCAGGQVSWGASVIKVLEASEGAVLILERTESL